jgi:hypothetical protein
MDAGGVEVREICAPKFSVRIIPRTPDLAHYLEGCIKLLISGCVDQFIPREGMSKRTLDFRVAAQGEFAYSFGERGKWNGSYVVAIDHAFRGQSFGGAERNFDGYMADCGRDFRRDELVEI